MTPDISDVSLDQDTNSPEALVNELNELMPYVVEQYDNMFNTGVTVPPEICYETMEDAINFANSINTALGYQWDQDLILSKAESCYYSSCDGYIDPFNNKAFLKEKTLKDRALSIYVACHETAHGIIEKMGLNNINEVAYSIENEIKYDENDCKSVFLKKVKLIPYQAISEGLAEYMTINLILNNSGQNPLIEQTKEKTKPLVEKYELRREKVPLAIECFSMIEKELEDPNLEQISDVDSRFQNILRNDLGTFPYFSGYGYVVSQLAQGRSIMDIISNVPQTLEEMLPEDYIRHADKDALFNNP